MARKKEPERVEINRNKIAEVAKQMFLTEGLNAVNMNEIAKKVKMSKSTLYVYFQNKEQIYNYITLGAMQQFYDQMSSTLSGECHDLHDIYLGICNALVDFKENNPISFEMIIKNICVEDLALKEDTELRQIYEIGEQINQVILEALSKVQDQQHQQEQQQQQQQQQDQKKHQDQQKQQEQQQQQNQEQKQETEQDVISKPLVNQQTIFTLWGALYGLITLASNKEEYIKKSMGISKEEFLRNGFEQLFTIGGFVKAFS